MTLRKRTLISIGLTIIALILVLYIASRVIVLGSFAALEEQHAHQNMEQILGVIQDDITALDIFTRDWAAWDSTYEFIQDANQDYIETNLVTTTFSSSKLNFILMINESGDVVYGEGYDPETQEMIVIPQSLLEHTTGKTILANHPNPESVVKGLLLLPEGPLLVASRPILTSDEQGPVRGAVIMAHYLDDARIALLVETTRIPFTLQRFANASALHTALSVENPIIIRTLNAETLTGYGLLSDVYGAPGMVLQAEMPRDIYQHGQRSVSYFILSLLVAGLVFGLITFLILEKSVLARLAHLSVTVARIGVSGDLSTRMSITGQDELSGLADDINEMLAALEQAQLERERAEAALRQAFRQVKKEKKRADDLLEVVIPIGVELASERDFNHLLESMLVEAQTFCHANGGILYLRTEDEQLTYVIVRHKTRNIALGGATDCEIIYSPIQLYDATDGSPNDHVLEARVALEGVSVNIADVTQYTDMDISGIVATGHATSLLAIPLKNSENQVLGVLQLMDAQEPETGEVIAFDPNLQQMMESFSSLAVAALEAYIREQNLRQEIRQLHIEINEDKRQTEVSKIVDSDFFRDLQSKVERIRHRFRKKPGEES